MKFKLIEDSNILEHIEKNGSAEDTEEVDSEDFFQLNTKNEYSSEEEEEMWEDSNEEKNENYWTVEKIEKKPGKVRKTAALTKNLLKYTVSHLLTIKKKVQKMEIVNDTVYILDTTGNIYICSSITQEKEDKQLRRIEIQKGNKTKQYKDFVIIKENIIIALTKAFHSFVVIDTEKGTVKEVNLYQYKDKMYSKLRKTESGFILLSYQSLLIYNDNLILVDRIDLQERVVDLVEENGTLLILLESMLVKYCTKMKAIIIKSEVLIGPNVLSVFDECVAVGGTAGLTLFKKNTFEILKELSNLENVTGIEHMKEIGILVFGDKTKPNGIRLYNIKEQKVITTFPPGKGLPYVGGFTSVSRSLYFGAETKVYCLTVPE